MDDIRIILSGLWVSLMLAYLLGDVLRIFAGDYTAGEMQGMQGTQSMWMVAAIMMLIPIVMVSLTLTLSFPLIRWVNIGFAVIMFLFNLSGVTSYPGLYDRFLIIVGLVFNLVTIWTAWNWIYNQQIFRVIRATCLL